MPRVEIVQKHNTAARRLYIRGHNGKIYPYLVMNDACLTESRREERVLQLLRLLNPCLEKRKETTKRHLFFTGTAETPDHTETLTSPWNSTDYIYLCRSFGEDLNFHDQYIFKSISKKVKSYSIICKTLQRIKYKCIIYIKKYFPTLVKSFLNCGMHVFRAAPFECCPFALSAGFSGLVALRQIGGDEEKEPRLRWKVPEKLCSGNRRRKRGLEQNE